MQKTTWKDVNLGNVDEMEFTAELFLRKHGKSTIQITCPFCGNTFLAFIWSMAGAGKRCDCGAILGGNTAYRKKKGATMLSAQSQ